MLVFVSQYQEEPQLIPKTLSVNFLVFGIYILQDQRAHYLFQSLNYTLNLNELTQMSPRGPT